ncbi:MAG: hypothetical protein ACNA7O_09440 [Rhodobacterales bacterium]
MGLPSITSLRICDLALAALLSPTLATAQSPAAMPLTYAIFEASVPHIDLAACPETLALEGVAMDGVFCRAVVHDDAFHVYVFSLDGDSPAIGFQSYPVDGVETLMK